MRQEELIKKMGELIHKHRLKQGISQVDLSRKIGCTQGTLSKIENGRSEPSVFVWIKLTNIFKSLRQKVENLEEFSAK